MTNRRQFLTGAISGAAISAATGIVGANVISNPTRKQPESRLLNPLGANQNGIELHPQKFTKFIALDVKGATTKDLMQAWMTIITDDINRLTQGRPLLADSQPELSTEHSNLTITVGFGPELFSKLKILDRAPVGFQKLPSFSIDQLNDKYSDGDVLFHVASDSQLHLEHVTRALIRDSIYFAKIRWIQSGFSSIDPNSPLKSQRNLMGQIDGTDNPQLNTQFFKDAVWADSGPSWYHNGTMLVLRRIEMNLDTWDTMEAPQKEEIIGRKLSNGAPLSGNNETDPLILDARDENGLSKIPPFAHVARARSAKGALPIFRRPFNYTDGFEKNGSVKAGLLWTAYAKDVYKQYVPIQESLAQFDLLNKWTTPIGSSLFACPGGRSKDSTLVSKDLFQ
jgi:dye decolorizing peroxidase